MAGLFNTPDNLPFEGIVADEEFGKAKKGTPEYEKWLEAYRAKRGKKQEEVKAGAKETLESKSTVYSNRGQLQKPDIASSYKELFERWRDESKPFEGVTMDFPNTRVMAFGGNGSKYGGYLNFIGFDKNKGKFGTAGSYSGMYRDSELKDIFADKTSLSSNVSLCKDLDSKDSVKAFKDMCAMMGVEISIPKSKVEECVKAIEGPHTVKNNDRYVRKRAESFKVGDTTYVLVQFRKPFRGVEYIIQTPSPNKTGIDAMQISGFDDLKSIKSFVFLTQSTFKAV